MSDFEARIRASIDLGDAQNKLNTFLNNKYKVDIDFGNGTFSKFSTTINKEMASTGKTASAAFSKGFTSSKFKFDPIDFAKTKQKLQKETGDISKIIEKGVSGATKSDSGKWANQYITKRELEYQKIISNEEKNIAKLKSIRDKELSSKNYGNKAQEYYNKEYSRSNELTKMKTYYQEQEHLALKVEQIRKRANSGEFEYNNAKNNSFLSKYNGIDSSFIDKAKSQIKEITSLQKELQFGKYLDRNGSLTSKTLIPEDEISKANKLDDTLKKLSTTMKTVSLESSKPISSLDAISASNKTLQYLKTNTKAVKEYGAAFENLAAKQKTATTKDQLSEYSKEYKNLVNQVQIAGKTGRSFGSEFGNAFSRIGQFVGIYGILQRGMQTVGKMATEVLNVDNAMTSLQMATGASNQEATKLMKTYSQMGKELKATGVDVSTSATEWLKQGKSEAQSQELAKDSIVLSKIGDLSSTDSTKYLTSAMKGYKVETENVLGIVDKLSAVDLASATDVGGLASGMSEVANNANLAGVSMDKLLGYLATVGEVTQEGMSTVGHSFSTIFSRMGNVKLARLKDYQNNGEDLSNVETVLRGEGIQLRDNNDTFRNFGEVIDEVAGKWDSYSEVSQRAIASAFAGKNQMEEFLVLMQNYDKAQQYENLSKNSSGQALEKFGAYQNSLAGKLEGFKNQFQDFSATMFDSNMFKGAIEGGTQLLNIFTRLAGLGGGTGLLGILGAGVGTTAFLKNLDWAKPCLHTYNLLLSGSIHMENAA